MTFLMVIVLGSIFAGWATATESAGVGVLGSFVIAWLNNRLNMKMVQESIRVGLPGERAWCSCSSSAPPASPTCSARSAATT